MTAIPLRIAVLKETAPGETRVALTPETAKKFVALGATVAVEAGAGMSASITDAAYAEAGAEVGPAGQAVKGADIVMGVAPPDPAALAGANPGAWVAAVFDPFAQRERVEAYANAGYEALAMEFMPRITRAQSMDVLSSQSNLAGYKAVIAAADAYGRAFPMMMTAAGTVQAAKVFVMGVGVAGLQAIATARRLGAVVTATDVRPAAKEQAPVREVTRGWYVAARILAGRPHVERHHGGSWCRSRRQACLVPSAYTTPIASEINEKATKRGGNAEGSRISNKASGTADRPRSKYTPLISTSPSRTSGGRRMRRAPPNP